MKQIAIIVFACLFATGLFAAWSADPNNPTLIAGYSGEQVMPKVAIAPNGNTFICFFDTSFGAYRVYLKLLDINGTPIWPDDYGLLVSSHPQMSWLTEYDMDVDVEGNAVIVFQDIRNSDVNNVVAYKIDQDGNQLWGADGIALSNDTSMDWSNMSPVCFCSNDGSSYFAWQRMGTSTSVVINRLDADGVKLWGEGITLTPTEGSHTWPQIIQGEGTNILLKLYQDTGPFWSPTRHLLVKKITPEGTIDWTAIVTNAGGITAWQQLIPFEPDGFGGAVLAWYEDREVDWDNDVYCQRVTGIGETSMPNNGALVSVDPVNQQYYPKVAVDTATQQIYVFYRVTDADQNNAGLARQLLSINGERLWGDVGPSIIDISPWEANTVAAYHTPAGAVFLYESEGDNLYASCWNPAGDPVWSPSRTAIAISGEIKYHFDHHSHPDQWCVLGWEQGGSEMDVYAMRINGDGSLGGQTAEPMTIRFQTDPPTVGVAVFLDGVLLGYTDEYGYFEYTAPVEDLLGEYTFVGGGINWEPVEIGDPADIPGPNDPPLPVEPVPVTPVELSSFTATVTAVNEVELTWVSQSENNMNGYRVHRNSSANQSGSISITPILIPATNSSTVHTYNLTDNSVEIGTTYYYWLEAVDYLGSDFHGPVSVTVTGNVPPVLPEITSMKDAYPNPFKTSATIEVSVKAGETGTMTIYNVAGKAVRSYSVTEGVHNLNWDGKDSAGKFCGSGIYFYRLDTPSFNQTRKLVIVK